jgi:hypothetical protein
MLTQDDRSACDDIRKETDKEYLANLSGAVFPGLSHRDAENERNKARANLQTMAFRELLEKGCDVHNYKSVVDRLEETYAQYGRDQEKRRLQEKSIAEERRMVQENAQAVWDFQHPAPLLRPGM